MSEQSPARACRGSGGIGFIAWFALITIVWMLTAIGESLSRIESHLGISEKPTPSEKP